MNPTRAIVVGVSSKETTGIPKVPREQITLVADCGVEGDYHAGRYVRHRSRAAKDPAEPNRRQVHLIHSELFDELAALGITVAPGQMGENITTRGLALLDLAPGALLHVGDSAVVEVTGLRNPCNSLDIIDGRVLGHVAKKLDDGTIARKAGVMGVVLAGGVVRPGDPIRVELPADAGGKLQPV